MFFLQKLLIVVGADHLLPQTNRHISIFWFQNLALTHTRARQRILIHRLRRHWIELRVFHELTRIDHGIDITGCHGRLHKCRLESTHSKILRLSLRRHERRHLKLRRTLKQHLHLIILLFIWSSCCGRVGICLCILIRHPQPFQMLWAEELLSYALCIISRFI